MVEIEAGEIDGAFCRFCDIMGFPYRDRRSCLWGSILEFTVFAGFSLFTDPDAPEHLYPHDVRRKVESVLGPHGETIVKAYKVRRYTIIGRVLIPIRKTVQAMGLFYYISFVDVRKRWRRLWW